MIQRLWAACIAIVATTIPFVVTESLYAAKPADAIPDSASLVVRWKAPQTSINKLADYVDAVQPGFGIAVKASLPSAGGLLRVPGLGGVDLESDIWLIVFAEPQAIPTAVFIVTAKDVEAVKKALPEDMEVEVSDNLVIYSEDEDALGEVKSRLGGKGNSLFARVDDLSLKLFEASDLSTLVNVKLLAEDFSAELDQAMPRLEQFLEQINNVMPEGQRAQMAAVMDVYRVMGQSILQGVRDTDSLTLGLNVSKSAIRFESVQKVTDGTITAAELAKQPVGDLALIGKLPANKAVYIHSNLDMQEFMTWSMNMSKNLLSEASDEQKAIFDEAAKEFKKLKYDEIAVYFDLVGSSPAMRTGAVSLVTPTRLLRELSHKMAKSMSELKIANLTQSMKLEPNAEKVSGNDVDRMTVIQEIDESADPLGMQKKMQQVLFGDAGMQTRVLYQANRAFQTMGGGTAELQSLLDAVESKKAADAAITASRKRFTAKSNLIGLVDIARLAISGIKLADQQKVLPFDGTAVDQIKLTPSFVGFSLAISKTSVQSQLDIPVEQAQDIAKIVQSLRPRP